MKKINGIYEEDWMGKPVHIDVDGNNNEGCENGFNGNNGVEGHDGEGYDPLFNDNPDGIAYEEPKHSTWPYRPDRLSKAEVEILYDVENSPENLVDLPDNDPVSQPSHYKIGNTGVEVIDVIRATLTLEEFRGFCKGSIIKYQLRANKKNGAEDLCKADMYSSWLVESLEED